MIREVGLDFAASPPIPASLRRGYVICASPRSGSTLLAYLLLSTGVLGVPSEWLRGDGGSAGDGYDDYPSDPVKQLDFVLRDGSSSDGVFGLKMFPEHFDTTTICRWAQALPELRFVNLKRRDLVGQAISLAIARQTHSYGAWTPERQEPTYDREYIRHCLHFLTLGESRWRLFFALNAISPLELVYENVIADPQCAVDQVAYLVGVQDARIDWDRVATKRQRTARNLAWKERFLQEEGDLTSLPLLEIVDVGRTVYAT